MRSAKWTRVIVGAVACALGVSASLSGCSAETPTAGAPDPGLRGQWVLTSGHDGYGPTNLFDQEITLTVTGEAISTGRSSCSDYTARIYGSQRALWVTAITPKTFNCTTAEQSLLQLEYLSDLRGISHSAVTPAGLELAGSNIDLHFTRATHLSLTKLVDRIWQLKTSTTLNLHGASTVSSEPSGYLRFDTKSGLTGVTRCVTFNADYRQDANQLVASHILAVENLTCDRSSDQAAKDFTRMFDGGFTFALGRSSLALKSSQASLTLGFQELTAP